MLIVRPGLGKALLGPFLVCRGKRMLHSQMGFPARGKAGSKSPAILKMKQLDHKTCTFFKSGLDVF